MPRYSDVLMEHFTHPRNVGRLAHPDAIGVAGTPGDGPYFVLSIRVLEDRIVQSAYQTYGCGPTIASGSLLTELIQDRTLADCLSLTAASLAEALGGVPPDKLHCPALAVGALHAAVCKYQELTSPAGQSAKSATDVPGG
jgi:nitrogen fixation NifU-like protein